MTRDITKHCKNKGERDNKPEGDCGRCSSLHCRYNVTPIGVIREDGGETVANDCCPDFEEDEE